jgi:hypothetical protein
MAAHRTWACVLTVGLGVDLYVAAVIGAFVYVVTGFCRFAPELSVAQRKYRAALVRSLIVKMTESCKMSRDLTIDWAAFGCPFDIAEWSRQLISNDERARLLAETRTETISDQCWPVAIPYLIKTIANHNGHGRAFVMLLLSGLSAPLTEDQVCMMSEAEMIHFAMLLEKRSNAILEGLPVYFLHLRSPNPQICEYAKCVIANCRSPYVCPQYFSEEFEQWCLAHEKHQALARLRSKRRYADVGPEVFKGWLDAVGKVPADLLPPYFDTIVIRAFHIDLELCRGSGANEKQTRNILSPIQFDVLAAVASLDQLWNVPEAERIATPIAEWDTFGLPLRIEVRLAQLDLPSDRKALNDFLHSLR